MPDDATDRASEQEREAPSPLLRLSLRTKALVIANEYTHRQMKPEELRQVLWALAPTPEERSRIAQSVEEELRAARYPVGEIMRLMGCLIPPGGGAPAEPAPESVQTSASPAQPQSTPPAEDARVLVTRKTRPPHLMPFEKFQFRAPTTSPEPQAPPPSHPPPAGQAQPPPTVPMTAPRPLQAPGVAGVSPEPALGGFAFSASSDAEQAQAAMPAGLVPTEPPQPSSRPLVLVADDDSRARMMYRTKLEDMGYAVIEAKDGVDAWNHIRTGLVKCAVLDMKMPGYHGLEILGRIVDAGMSLPVVVVSAFDQLADEFVVSTYPKLKFLTKPASPEMVLDAVASYVRPGR